MKDPTAKLSSRHEKTVKNYVKEFLDKAVKKQKEREKHTGDKAETQGNAAGSPEGIKAESDEDMLDIKDADTASHEVSPATSELKRKRTEDSGFDSPKRTRTSDDLEQVPRVPPPPPPVEDMPADMDLTPMDESESRTPSFVVAEDSTHDSETGKTMRQANGHLSPMQLATPPTNGTATRQVQPVNGEAHRR